MSFKAQPAQIRASASTHTALMKDEWRKSVRQDMGGGLGVVVSTVPRPGWVSPTSSSRFGCGERGRCATVD